MSGTNKGERRDMHKAAEVVSDKPAAVSGPELDLEVLGGGRQRLASLLTSGGDKVFDVAALAEAIAETVPADRIKDVVVALVRGRKADDLRALVDVVEILSTRSVVDDPARLEILEGVAQTYGLRQWAELTGGKRRLGRGDVMEWWKYFMQMVGMRNGGGESIGGGGSQAGSLWKATAQLASKMTGNPSIYAFLPPYLINHPTEVSRVLGEIEDPRAFLEVLTGETWEALSTSEAFLAAFAGAEPRDGQNIAEAVIETVILALQKARV